MNGDSKSFSSGCFVSFSLRIACSVGRHQSAQTAVEYAYTSVSLGMIELIALVQEHCGLAEYGESVCKTLGDEELTGGCPRSAQRLHACRMWASLYECQLRRQARLLLRISLTLPA